MILLGNILATLVITIGVATGNVSSNNTKYGNALITNEGESTHTKPIQKVNYISTLTYNEVNTYNSSYYDADNDLNIEVINKKYYIDNNVSANTEIGTIYNSTYTESRWTHTPSAYYPKTVQVGLYEITPYLTSNNTEITIENDLELYNTNNVGFHSQVLTETYKTTNNHYQQYIDLTTYSAYQIYEQIIADGTTYDLYKINQDSEDLNLPPTGTVGLYDYEVNIGTIEQTTMVIICRAISQYNNQSLASNSKIEAIPQTFTISGNVIPINYEVIDLPGLMFQILTMPFSFISTAFNLTVFPGTPYAFNFGNVFLTLIAAFILMWLLKKVLK